MPFMCALLVYTPQKVTSSFPDFPSRSNPTIPLKNKYLFKRSIYISDFSITWRKSITKRNEQRISYISRLARISLKCIHVLYTINPKHKNT
ncbi:hypothetical protein EMIT0194P_110127 [Pseudomonas serbica]